MADQQYPGDQFPKVVTVYPGDKFEPPTLLSDFQIRQIHCGLMIPSWEAIRSMCREIRFHRGDPDPDSA